MNTLWMGGVYNRGTFIVSYVTFPDSCTCNRPMTPSGMFLKEFSGKELCANLETSY